MFKKDTELAFEKDQNQHSLHTSLSSTVLCFNPSHRHRVPTCQNCWRQGFKIAQEIYFYFFSTMWPTKTSVLFSGTHGDFLSQAFSTFHSLPKKHGNPWWEGKGETGGRNKCLVLKWSAESAVICEKPPTDGGITGAPLGTLRGANKITQTPRQVKPVTERNSQMQKKRNNP